MDPRERLLARRKIAKVQRQEDAQARRFLRTILEAAGPRGMMSSDIHNLAVECGIWWRCVRRAKAQMGVLSVRTPGSRTRAWKLP